MTYRVQQGSGQTIEKSISLSFLLYRFKKIDKYFLFAKKVTKMFNNYRKTIFI